MKLAGRTLWGVILVASVAGLWSVAPAFAQTVQQQGLRPVDQRVADIDPTQVSLRHEYSGLSTIGERQNVFRRIVPGAGPYAPSSRRLYFVSYGVVAEFDRSEYAMTRKGAILQFIPPNTVFHIGLPAAPKPKLDSDTPVRGRVRARVDAMVRWVPSYDAAVTGRPVSFSQSRRNDRNEVAAHRYHEMLVAQRGMVVAAIDRISRLSSP